MTISKSPEPLRGILYRNRGSAGEDIEPGRWSPIIQVSSRGLHQRDETEPEPAPVMGLLAGSTQEGPRAQEWGRHRGWKRQGKGPALDLQEEPDPLTP